MTPEEKKIYDNLTGAIQNLTKAFAKSGSTPIQTSSNTNKGISSKEEVKIETALNKILQDNLKTHKAYLDISDKIKKKEEEILKLQKEDDALEKKKQQNIKNLNDLIVLNQSKRIAINRDALDAIEKQIALKQKDIDLDNKEISLLEQKKELEAESQKEKEKYYKDNKARIDAETAAEEAKLKRQQKILDISTKANNFIHGKSEGFVGKKVYQGLEFGLSTIWKSLLEQDAAVSALAANYALSSREVGNLRIGMGQAVGETLKLGVGWTELAKIQSSFTDNVGRSVMLTKENLIDLTNIGVATSIGTDGASEMASTFEMYGSGIEGMVKNTTDLIQNAKAQGVSASVATAKFAQNLKIANSMPFKDGIQGIQRMTVESEKLKVNFSEIKNFADKVSTPEGAIELSAVMQNLGGSFAAAADPMQMFAEGLTDNEALMKRYVKIADGLVKVNKKTGEIKVDPYQKVLLKQLAQSSGLNPDEILNTSMTKAKREMITQDLKVNTNIKDEDTRNLIASIAQKNKNGDWAVNIKGQSVAIAKLTAEQIKEIQPDNLSVAQIAQSTLSIQEKIFNEARAIANELGTKITPALNAIKDFLANPGKSTAKAISGTGSEFMRGTYGTAGTAISGGGEYLSKYLGKSSNPLLKTLGKASGAATYAAPVLAGVLSGLNEYAENGKKGAAIGNAIGTMAGSLAGGLLVGGATGGAGAMAGSLALGYAGGKLGSWIGGWADSANDVYIPSEGRPMKLDSKDDVFAMKPGGALVQAVTQGANFSSMFPSVSPEFSGLYSSGGNNHSGSINLKLEGTINLVGGGNSAQINAHELVKNQQFMRELVRLIGTQTSKDENGGKYTGKFGNNAI